MVKIRTCLVFFFFINYTSSNIYLLGHSRARNITAIDRGKGIKILFITQTKGSYPESGTSFPVARALRSGVFLTPASYKIAMNSMSNHDTE